jgi:hypothetical protein
MSGKKTKLATGVERVLDHARKDRFLKQANQRLLACQAIVDEWKKELTEDPALAMDKADAVFRAAAGIRVHQTVIDGLTGEDSRATLESLSEHAERKLRQLARPRHSSSPSENLMHGEERAAWSELLDLLDEVMKFQ